MNSVREIVLKNCLDYDDVINTRNLDPNKIKIDDKSYKNIFVSYIGCVTPNSIKPLKLLSIK